MNILDKIAALLPMTTISGNMPDKPDKIVALFEYAAPPPTQYHGGDIGISYNVQARCRANKPEDAYALAEAVQNALRGYEDDEKTITQTSAILGIGQDKHNPPRQEYTVNFNIFMK